MKLLTVETRTASQLSPSEVSRLDVIHAREAAQWVPLLRVFSLLLLVIIILVLHKYIMSIFV